MEGEHAQMLQIPCKMTNSSSKPLQTLGKWYQPRNAKKNPKPAQKKNLKLFHTQYLQTLDIDILPSGKHTKSHGKSQCLMGKSTISMAIFNRNC